MPMSKFSFRSTGGRLAAVAVTAALVLSACGSSDGGGGKSAAPTTDPDAPALTGTPVKLGLAIALTGPKADATKNIVDIAEGWVVRANSTGGIGGRPVELVVKDTKSDASTAQTAVKDLVESEKVAAIFINDTGTEGAIGDYLEDSGVPVIGAEGYNTELWGVKPSFYTYWLDIPGTIYASPHVAKTLGSENFAAISCSESAACAQAEQIYEPASEGLGMTWSGMLTIAASAPDYTAECLTLIERDVDFVILSVVSSVATRVVSDCLQQGYDGYFGSTAGGFEEYLFEEVPGAKIAGALHAFPWFTDDEPVVAYREFLETYAPDAEYRSGMMSAMYAGLELFHQAVADVEGDLTPEVVKQAYADMPETTLDGLLPQPFKVTPGEPVAKGACYWPYEYDTTTGDLTVLEVEGEPGNGAEGSLATACIPELQD